MTIFLFVAVVGHNQNSRPEAQYHPFAWFMTRVSMLFKKNINMESSGLQIDIFDGYICVCCILSIVTYENVHKRHLLDYCLLRSMISTILILMISCGLFTIHSTNLPLDKMAAILADDKFKCIFFNENYRIPIRISLKIWSQECNWQLVSIGSGNGLAPNRQQTIIRTNADATHWRIYASLGGDELSLIWLLIY